MSKAKPTPICPFMYHLYECKGLLTEEEETDYTTAKELNRYEIPPERDEDSDSEILCITRPEPKRALASVNQVKRGKRNRKSHQEPEGSQPIRSRGEGSRPSSEGARSVSRPVSPRPASPRPLSSQPERSQPEDRPWVRKPFDPVRESYKVVKSQYLVIERFIEEISNFFNAESAEVMDRIRALPKPEDLTDLQAGMDCLLKENTELRARLDEGDTIRAKNKELKDWIKEAEKEVKVARTERDKSKEIAQKVCKFLGSPGDVLIAQQSTIVRPRPQAARNRLWSEDDALYDRLQPKDGKDTQGVARPSQADRRPTGADRDARSSTQHHPRPNC